MTSKLKGSDEIKYETTKDLSHQKIMNLGEAIHMKTLDILEEEKFDAVKEATEKVWIQAKDLQEQAVQEALKNAKKEHDLEVLKLRRQSDKAVKAEAEKVTTEMQEKLEKAVEEEKERGNQITELRVQETLAKCESEKIAAVATARKEEQNTAAKKLAERIRVEQARTEKLLKEKEEAHAADLASAKVEMDANIQKLLSQAVAKERGTAQQNAESKRLDYFEQIQSLVNEIQQKEQAVSKLSQEKETLQKSKTAAQTELLETREAFQRFIDRTSPFEEGFSDYVLPPVRSVSSKKFTMDNTQTEQGNL